MAQVNGQANDDAIITRCWLYSAETCDPADSEVMTIDGRAALIKKRSPMNIAIDQTVSFLMPAN